MENDMRRYALAAFLFLGDAAVVTALTVLLVVLTSASRDCRASDDFRAGTAACAGSFCRPSPSRRDAVIMMKPAEYRNRGDRAGELESEVSSGDRNPLSDPLVGPCSVEVAQCVFGEDTLKVLL
jgi:hypothetical protein